MRNVLLAFGLLVFSTVFTVAQTTVVDDYKQGEFYIGYSNGQVDTGLDSGSTVGSFFRDRVNFHGVNVSGVGNVNRFLGIKGDVSVTTNSTAFSETFTNPTTGARTTASFDTRNTLINLVGGLQVKDNSLEGRVKPFGHAMIGLGHARTRVNDVVCTPAANCPITAESFTTNGFSGVFGGGLDFRVGDRVQIRAIQIDYNPIRFSGQTDHNLRLGAGIVF